VSSKCETLIIGAGPYGLSIAAHLRASGLEHRIIGGPLDTWRHAMPKGMRLKSDGFASNLSAPVPDSTLFDYCLKHELPYHPTLIPVPLDTFVDYGLDFQRRFVPHLEPGEVVSVARAGQSFRVALDGGQEIEARHVIVATGITHFAVTPAEFTNLSPEWVTHASAHHDLTEFAGRDVTVIGAGSSAVEVAVGLAAAGARSRLVARTSPLKFSSAPDGGPRSLLARVRQPGSGLGPGMRSRLFCDVPELFRFLPSRVRAEIVRRHLGPSSPWYLKDTLESTVDVLTGRTVRRVEKDGDRVSLQLAGDEQNGHGHDMVVETDHVICATGYRADLARLRFLEPGMQSTLRTVNRSPVLDFDFESSVPGLFFVGIPAAMTFGPLMRFMYGDEFAARRITRRLAKRSM
jgi:thioredoxin reductase